MLDRERDDREERPVGAAHRESRDAVDVAGRAYASGFQRALLIGSIFILASAVVALRATNTRGETEEPTVELEAEPDASLAA